LVRSAIKALATPVRRLRVHDTPQICTLQTLGGQSQALRWVILRDGVEIG